MQRSAVLKYAVDGSDWNKWTVQRQAWHTTCAKTTNLESRILSKTQTIEMKELISRSVMLIFCLSFLIFGTRESQAIGANISFGRRGRKRTMNEIQVIFYLLSAAFQSTCQPSERNLENNHCAVHFFWKLRSFFYPSFGHLEVGIVICFLSTFFSFHYPSTKLTRSWSLWAIIAVKRQAIQATLTETNWGWLFCTFVHSFQCRFMFLTFLSLTLLFLLL